MRLSEDNVETIDMLTEEHHNAIQIEADKKVKKILKKNKTEIKRLKLLAEKALIEDNRESYVYAIGKLRDIYRQPHTPELLHVMYDTSRATILSML